jgi:hypothetical protein
VSQPSGRLTEPAPILQRPCGIGHDVLEDRVSDERGSGHDLAHVIGGQAAAAEAADAPDIDVSSRWTCGKTRE